MPTPDSTRHEKAPLLRSFLRAPHVLRAFGLFSAVVVSLEFVLVFGALLGIDALVRPRARLAPLVGWIAPHGYIFGLLFVVYLTREPNRRFRVALVVFMCIQALYGILGVVLPFRVTSPFESMDLAGHQFSIIRLAWGAGVPLLWAIALSSRSMRLFCRELGGRESSEEGGPHT